MGEWVTTDGYDGLVKDFRAAMSVVTEQACRDGLELDVLEALFPVVLPGIGDDDGEDRPL
jgi:hypothetical protein